MLYISLNNPVVRTVQVTAHVYVLVGISVHIIINVLVYIIVNTLIQNTLIH